MSDALRERVRADALEHAASAAWEHDHPSTPWEQAPDSVRVSMRALVRPTVDAVLEHLDARALLDLDPEPDTFPLGPAPFDAFVTFAVFCADYQRRPVRMVLAGVAVIAEPGDSWQDVAGRYTAAAEEAAR